MSARTPAPEFVVAQFKDATGAICFEALQPAELKEKSCQLTKAYLEAVKEYSKLKAEEKKLAAKPTRPAIRKVTILNDKDRAAKFAAALQEKYEEVQERKNKGREGERESMRE